MIKRNDLEWIPWKRYAVLLGVDAKRVYCVGRFMLRKSACRVVNRLNLFLGYEAEVVDTRGNRGSGETVKRGNGAG